jgi:hypothetical protein
MTSRLELARRNLDAILNREIDLHRNPEDNYVAHQLQKHPDWTEYTIREILGQLGQIYLISENAPELLSKGEHQLVLSLGHSYVGKTKYYDIFDGKLVCRSKNVYETQIRNAEKVLRDIGILFPSQHYFGISIENNQVSVPITGMEFIITKDLRENGKYEIADADFYEIDLLLNGQEIREHYNLAIQSLISIYQRENPQFSVSINWHSTNIETRNPEIAFRRMFFLQIDSFTNTGKLVVGDIDHVKFYVHSNQT